MFIIGELINGMYSSISAAIRNKDKSAIQECALKQVACGADALDINCGPASRQPVEDMPWLVEVVQEVTDKTLCLDASKPLVIEAGLKVAKNKTMINSTTADTDKLNTLIPLAKKYASSLIGLTISAKGIPQDKNQRLELAVEIISACSENGFSTENLYLDPILMPVNVAQAQMKDILESIHEFKLLADPAPKTVVGLSNVSQGTHSRSLINGSFLAMAIAYGLDSAILNPLDEQLMSTLITAELIMNKNIYCASYLDAYRKR